MLRLEASFFSTSTPASITSGPMPSVGMEAMRYNGRPVLVGDMAKVEVTL